MGDGDGTETFEQGDDAVDEAARLDPDFEELREIDPSLDPNLQADEREREEAGAELDDPEQIATLDGLIDDPDGLGEPSPHTRARETDTEGWDLDAPVVPGDADDGAGGDAEDSAD
jgi:hypothetical protein